MKRAIAEVEDLIRERYPTATFTVAEGDDPKGIYIDAAVDVDDPDEVMDLIVDRLLEMQVDEELPLYVIPVSTPERVLKIWQEQQHDGHWRRCFDTGQADSASNISDSS